MARTWRAPAEGVGSVVGGIGVFVGVSVGGIGVRVGVLVGVGSSVTPQPNAQLPKNPSNTTTATPATIQAQFGIDERGEGYGCSILFAVRSDISRYL
jgi:hypothetical protein